MDNRESGQWQVTVNGIVKGTFDTLELACEAARKEKQINRGRHVSVRDKLGISIPEDCLQNAMSYER